MASPRHMNVDRPQQANGNLYADGGEGYAYGSMFSATAPGQAYEQTWSPLDPSLAAVNAHDAAPFPQSWHHSSQPQQQPPPRPQIPFSANNNFYGASFASSSAGFPNSSYAFAGHANNFNAFSNAALDPSLVTPTTTAHNGSFASASPFYPTSANQATVAPAALHDHVPSKTPTPVYNTSNRPALPIHGRVGSGVSPMGQSVFSAVLPKGVGNGRFLMIDGDELAKVTKSTKLSNFVNIGVDEQEYAIQRIAKVASLPPRKSRNEIKKLAEGDPKILAKLSKRQSKTSKTKAPKIPRPRLPFGRTDSKDVSTPSSIETSSSEEDSDYSSSDDDLDIIETPPLPESRPQGAFDAVKYDTIKAVWLARKLRPTADQIRIGLKDLWEVLRTLRDRWKSDGDALKVATEAKKHSELPMLRERVKSQRDMLQVALAALLEHGNPELLALVGEIRPFLQLCRLFFSDRVRDNDVDGQLTKLMLELLRGCTTITTELLDEYNLKKILTMYTKRGNDATKKLVKEVEDKAAANSKAQAEKSKLEKPAADGKEKDVKAKSTTSTTPRTSTPDSISVVKKSLGDPTAKRSASTGPSSVKPSPTLQKRSPSTVVDKTATTGTGAAAAKPKVQPAAKVPSMYSGLQSAGKKSTATPATASKKITTPATEKKAAPPAASMVAKSTSTFSFSDYMRDLNKPKEPERPKKDQEEERPPETEEQRAKRLRKESRRKLRVSFKEGPALVQVRYFHHEVEEDSGRDANMVLNAGDVGDEGRMFKQHKEMEYDEDEEMADADDDRLLEFKSPTLIDFSTVEVEERNRNYAPYGGGQNIPDSPEKAVQEKHESDTLIQVYVNRADIPADPREPANPYSGETMPVREFGVPPQNILDRAAAFQPHQAAASAESASTVDISAILSAFGKPTQQPSQPQQVAQPAQNGFENLQNIFAQYSTPNQPVPQPQPEPQIAQHVSTTPDLTSILASLQAHGSTPQPQQAPTPQPPQMPQMPRIPQIPNVFPPAGQAPDFNAMMAIFAQAGMPPPTMPGFAPQMMQQGSNDGHYEHPERKRMRENGEDGEDGDRGYPQKKKFGGKKKTFGEKPKYVVACKFYKEGNCRKGADCTFVHE
ncbi:hypothetical protein NA57DRAFT_78048 [Rhizodiscina lignyota]|uniref:C3H1-type domain-containing protein n=1 Tax=Rhizodiscina lignyota TaxID=1504668 RepID=A0A9P4M845_9PEZI|nr:hypothetical protein NA57DRAFT_78048 [Rhizodiscina lignyota]